MDFAPPKCLEFPAHQWWRPATEIPVGEDENPLPFLHIKFRPWGKRMERSSCTGQFTKGGSQLRPCWYGERAQPTGWRNKRNLWAHISDMFRIVWLQAQLDPGAYTKPFSILSLSIFQFWFSSLCSLHSWAICLCGGFSGSRPKTYQKENFSPNTSHRSLLLSCFGSDLDHKPRHCPTHCGQGNGVYRMAALGSWTHTWAMEQGVPSDVWGLQ